MKFYDFEIPIAQSMLELGDIAQHPFQRYFCYWAAFNNIYVLIGKRNGQVVQLNLDRNRNQRTQQKWGYTFPSVKIPQERMLIIEAVNQFSVPTKHSIITHPSVRFYVYRKPVGVRSKRDRAGQLINGVLNITRTVNSNLPVWSPINQQKFENYLVGDLSDQDELAEQIIFMLYTIRNNLVHGSKNQNEDNDVQVVEMALPLLELVVRSFITHP